MNKIIKAVTFDLDGLMVNTEDIYDDVCQVLLAKRGHAFDRQLKLKMMGHPGPVAIAIMKAELHLNDTVDQLASEIETLFHSIMPKKIKRQPGLMPLLQELESLKIPAAVATSSSRRHALAVLERCQIIKRFQFILTAEDVVCGKPDPEIYLLAATKHGIHPSQMLVLEDSVQGSLAGVAAGALTIAVPGHHSLNCDFSHTHHRAVSLADPLIRTCLAQR
ncbi:MAG: HAD family phosphatase, partial [Planctomycetota bacterium]|nr:HAD family phosphatase [Planctomycetota bacterium]